MTGRTAVEQALELARVLVQEGIDAAVATPHYNDEFPQRPAAEIRARVADMQRALDRIYPVTPLSRPRSVDQARSG